MMNWMGVMYLALGCVNLGMSAIIIGNTATVEHFATRVFAFSVAVASMLFVALSFMNVAGGL